MPTVTPEPLSSIPDALLLLTSSCPHCPAVLQALGALLKSGRIGRLEAINIDAHPERAQQLGVRGVPWVRIGPFELEGLRSQGELQRWAERAATDAGMADYFTELLKGGDLGKVVALASANAAGFNALLLLLGDPDTDLHVRVGIGAVMEHLRDSGLLFKNIAGLIGLTRHADARVRGDACHYLSLSGNRAAVEPVRALLQDPDPQVREVANDSLAVLVNVAPQAGGDNR